ncbi:MAG: hypothetical protein QXX17_01255 [Conexivisphaerales archaeon]
MKRIILRVMYFSFVIDMLVNVPNLFVAKSDPYLQTSHWQCTLGNPIFTTQYWTPIILLNSPYGGSATGTSSTSVYAAFSIAGITSSSQSSLANTISAQNGEAVGLFSLDNWTYYYGYNRLVPGEGKDQPCPGPYVAKDTYHSNKVITYPLLPAGSQSDTNEITSFIAQDNQSGNYYPSITFSNGYTTNNDGYRNTCPGVSTSVQVSNTVIAEESFSISASYKGVQYSTNGLIDFTVTTSSSQVYTYYFPGYFGIWYFDSLTGAANGALAFSYSHC